MPRPSVKLSVIVPTFNEADNLARTLDSLTLDAEVVVSDGESRDETVAIAVSRGARVVTGSRSRARQMNRGASASSGDVLIFVHADCVLASDAGLAIRTALADARVVAGSFRLVIRQAGPMLRLVALGSNFRSRYLKTPYGDQGLFVRRETFEAVGGFRDLPFLEDLAMVRELKRCGRLVALDAPIVTGTRHWDRLGPLPTTLLNWSMVSLYLAGVSPEKLEPVYRRLLGKPGSEERERVLAEVD
ncbi:MAG TPA: TIGR04283 family arsenosugar biosynthesis glycosyltransferase [Vicinamibacteria bacterium]|nr:TIGR04283 family arsenosugar biosynthesis glycosyltransferase [Vicinamibacteria bacterium]